MTYYLKTANEDAMRTLLSSVLGDGFVDDDGEVVGYTHRWAVDWDVPVVSAPAVIDGDGNVTTPAVMETGFFANVAILDDTINASGLVSYDRTPNEPQRVFA